MIRNENHLRTSHLSPFTARTLMIRALMIRAALVLPLLLPVAAAGIVSPRSTMLARATTRAEAIGAASTTAHARLAQSPPPDPAPLVFDDIAYLTSPYASTVERWDLAANTALPPLTSIESLRGVTAGPRGVFALTTGTGRILRWPLDGGSSRPIAELADQGSDSIAIAALENHLVLIASMTIRTFDASTGAFVASASIPESYIRDFVVSADARAVFALVPWGDNTIRLVRFDVAADGHIAPPRVGTPTVATGPLFARPDGSRVIDGHGVIYDGATLGVVGAIARWPERAAFDGDAVYSTAGTHLWRWAGAGTVIERLTLERQPFGVAVDGGAVFTFARNADSQPPGRLVVTRIAATELKPYVAVPADAAAAPFTPDLVAMGADGDLVVGSVARRAVYRWSVAERRWRDGFALPAEPIDPPGTGWRSGLAYDPALDRVFIHYVDGGIDVMPLAGPSAGVATPFAFDGSNDPWTMGMTTAAGWLVLLSGSNFRDDMPNLFAPDGRGVGARLLVGNDASYRRPIGAAFDNAHARLVRLMDGAPRRVDVVPWDPSRGPITATLALEGSGLDAQAPLFVSPDGDTVVTGSGLVLSGPGLTSFDHLSSPVSAAAWPAGRLVTARTVFGHSELVAWGADHRPIAVQTVGGDIVGLFARGDNVLAVSRWNGGTVVSEWRTVGGFAAAWTGAPPSPANDAPDAPLSLNDGRGTVLADTDGATLGAAEPTASCGGADQRPVWFEKFLGLSEVTEVDTAGSTFPTIVSLWRKEDSGALVEVGCARAGIGDDAARLVPPSAIGTHLIAVSGQGGRSGRLVMSVDAAPRPDVESNIVAEDADGLWFARTQPPRLERWSFATSGWLSPTPLPAQVSHVVVGTGGLWLSANRRLFWLPKGAPTVRAVRAFDQPVLDLAAVDDGTLVLSGAAMWRLAADGALAGWRSLSAPRSIELVEPSLGRAWVVNDNMVRRWPLLPDGRIALKSVAPNRSIVGAFGQTPAGRHFHGRAGLPRFVDQAGTVVDTGDGRDRYRLEPPPAFLPAGQPFDRDGVHDMLSIDGAWVGATGSALATWDGAGTMTGWLGLPRPAVLLSRRGDTLFAALDYTRAGTPELPLEVVPVPLARLGARSTEAPDDPGATAWAPTSTAIGGDVAWLGSADLTAIRRWSISGRRWLPAVQLPDTPIRLAADDRRVWTWLADGRLLSGAAGADALVEVARLTPASCGLVAVDGRAFVCEMDTAAIPLDQSEIRDSHRPLRWSIRGADGRVVSQQDVPPALLIADNGVPSWSNWAWHAPTGRLVIAVGRRLVALPVADDGQLGSIVTSSAEHDVGSPTTLWVDAGGDSGLTSNGERFRPSDLTTGAFLSIRPGAAAWRDGRMWAAAPSQNPGPTVTTAIEVRRGDGGLERTGQIAGSASSLVPLAGGLLAIGGAYRPGFPDPGFSFDYRYSAPLLAEIDDVDGMPESFRLVAAPVNDRLAAALAINVGATEPLAVETAAAGDDGDGPAPSCAPNARGGVWFWVDAGRFSAAIDLAGTSYDAVVTAYPLIDGRPGPEFACAAGTVAAPASVAIDGGNARRYVIRLSAARAGTAGTARVRAAPAPPSNDRRRSAAVIATLPYTTTANLVNATREPGRDPGCAGDWLVDGWWRFTAPTAMRIQARLTQPFRGTIALAAWRGADGSELVDCHGGESDNGIVLRVDVNAGETIWFQNLVSSASESDFTFDVRAIPPAPPGDDFASAVDVPSLPYETTVSPGLAAAEPGERPPSCTGLDGEVGSLWWRFRAERATALRAFVSGGRNASVLSLWRGDTRPPVEVGCSNYAEALDFRGPRIDLAAGESIWIRLDGRVGEIDPRTLRLIDAVGPPNDMLRAATDVGALPYDGASAMAEAGVEEGEHVCGGEVARDVIAGDHTAWWGFTAPATGRVRIAASHERVGINLGVFVGDSHPLKRLSCLFAERGEAKTVVDVRAGVRYAVQVGTYGEMPDMDDAVHVAIEVVPPLTNDDLSTAEPVAPFSEVFAVNTERATNEPLERAPSCSPTAGRSLWWHLSASAESQVVRINVINADFDTVLSAWKGARHPLDEIACNDDDASTQDDRASLTLALEADAQVWVKLEGFADQGGAATVQFVRGDVRGRAWLPRVGRKGGMR